MQSDDNESASKIVEKLHKLLRHRKKVKKYDWFNGTQVYRVPSKESWLATQGYFLGDVIAKGYNNAVICQAEDILNGCYVAVKIVPMCNLLNQGMDKNYIKCNIRDVWMNLKHPNILELYDVIIGKHKIMVITEYACRGNILQFIEKDDQFESAFPLAIRRWCWQIANALKYIHKKNIAHLDLKLENILLNCKLNVKLSDIGFAWYNGEKNSVNFSKCLYPKVYLAPEILSNNMKSGLEADVWALGVIIFTLWNRCFPFLGFFNDKNYLIEQQQKPILWTKNNHGPLNALAHDLVNKILKISPAERPSVGQILRHRLFRIRK